MDIHDKLKILANAAKYDVSCSSSGSSRQNKNGLGNASANGICHSWSDDGRCISLLKILFSNYCIYDCLYCSNRASNDIARASFTPDELADLTISFYRRNYIEGLFLSSGVIKSPNYTMEKMISAIKKLRLEYGFHGYIHLKAIPGTSSELLDKAGRLVDRLSCNIELPSEKSLALLAPQKNREAVIKPMQFIRAKLAEKTPRFLPAGQTTQLIVGATKDTDLTIMALSEKLYQGFKLKRIYYSAYVPVSNNPNLPMLPEPPILREHRLYQADWLLRFYGFTAGELLNSSHPNFDLELDPKASWALRNLHIFPVEINRANKKTLLRIPGIGHKSAKKILAARRVNLLSFNDLKSLGVVLKRVKHFITCKGKYWGQGKYREDILRESLISDKVKSTRPKQEQLTIYSFLNK